MANLSSLTPITTQATALSNLILVSPQATIGYQPQNPPSKDGQTTQQPPALLFNYEGEQSSTLLSDITDHYVEDNTAIQDQIALKPEEITTHGFIGELNDVAPLGLQTIKAVADKLTPISAYAPAVSITAQVAYDTAFQLYQVAANAINAGVAAWSSIVGDGGESVITGNDQNPITLQKNQTQQQKYYQQFYGYWRNRTLFTIQTPWAVFQNMAIKSLRAVQSAETNEITDFEITFKLMRFASTQSVIATGQGRLYSQSSPETDLGTSTPVDSISVNDGLGSNYPGQFTAVG